MYPCLFLVMQSTIYQSFSLFHAYVFLSDPPDVMKSPEAGGGIKYEGIFIDLLISHSQILGFTYEIVEPDDGFYGQKKENGAFTGVMGLMQRGEVDFVYAVQQNTERKSVCSIYL